jgi:hypothetical protein
MRRRFFVGAMAMAALAVGANGHADGPERGPLGSGLASPRGVAATANGQTVICIDGDRNAIMAIDPGRGDAWREVVAPSGEGLPEPVAVGCLPGEVVAAVCRADDAWTLRTFRITPSAAADPGKPLQVVPLGDARGTGDGVSIAVNHARGWLVVAGLPPPLPPVVRAAVAGLRLGPLSDRACPTIPDGSRPVAVTGSPAGDLVLVLRRPDGDDTIAFYDAAGRDILRLPSGVRHLTGIDFGRGDGMLWAVGTDADGRGGLWRLDAILRDGRQAVRPVLIDAVASPQAVASASEKSLVIIHGGPDRSVSLVNPSALETTVSRRPTP